LKAERRSAIRWAAVGLLLVLAVGCRQGMYDQAKYEPLEASPLFLNGTSAREPVAGTVPRNFLKAQTAYYTGVDENGVMVETFPWPVTRERLERGRQRFDIFCSPCHGKTGFGDGMIVRRGYKQPTSFHSDRLRSYLPPGYVLTVIDKGFGQMPSYASQVPVEDRWAIAAYIKALQLSQQARVSDLTAEERERLEALPEGSEEAILVTAEEGAHHD
jgi:mono/diheme cytochrome c family protein